MEQNTKKIQTRKKIYAALLELSHTTVITEITVSELCRKAKINRSTFYLHYQDIADLINEIKEDNIAEFIKNIKAKRRSPQHIDLIKDTTVFIDYQDLVETFKNGTQQKELVTMLLSPNGLPDFYKELKLVIRDLLAYFYEDHLPELKAKFPGVPDDYLDIILFDTTAEIILHWYEKDRSETAEEVGRIISATRIVSPLTLLIKD